MGSPFNLLTNWGSRRLTPLRYFLMGYIILQGQKLISVSGSHLVSCRSDKWQRIWASHLLKLGPICILDVWRCVIWNPLKVCLLMASSWLHFLTDLEVSSFKMHMLHVTPPLITVDSVSSLWWEMDENLPFLCLKVNYSWLIYSDSENVICPQGTIKKGM